MRKKQLKEMRDQAIAYGIMNDILIEGALERLKKEDLSDEARIKNVEWLEKGLDARDKLEFVKNNYEKRKAEDTGYWIGIIGSLTGMLIVEVGPTIVKAIFKK